MQNFSDESVFPIKVVDFGCIPVDTVAEKIISVENSTEVSPLVFTWLYGSNLVVNKALARATTQDANSVRLISYLRCNSPIFGIITPPTTINLFLNNDFNIEL